MFGDVFQTIKLGIYILMFNETSQSGRPSLNNWRPTILFMKSIKSKEPRWNSIKYFLLSEII